MSKTVLDEVIAWNRRKAKEAEKSENFTDLARYVQNIEDLKLFKERQND